MLTLLWCFPTSIIILSFLYGIPTIYNIVKDLKKNTWINVNVGSVNELENSRVAIIVPLYREDKHSIEESLNSILNQEYPFDKITVYIVLESNDNQTKEYVDKFIEKFLEMGLAVHVHINSGSRLSKARAMNKVLSKIIDSDYNVIVVLDGGDKIIDRYYIQKCVKLIKRGYKVIGAKVYRVGKGFIARLSYIDTVLWYNVNFPSIYSLTKVPFLSGEGLALSTDFLKDIGGFPEVLAEDVYIAMLSFIRNEKVAFLNSIVFEGAPSTFESLIRQRLRWYKGGIECFKHFVLKYSRNVDKARAIAIVVAYLQIVALTAPFISLIIILSSIFIEVPRHVQLLARIELISLFSAPIVLYLANKVKDPVVFLAPFNWILQSFLALTALLPIKISWFRTSTRSKIYEDSIEYSKRVVKL